MATNTPNYNLVKPGIDDDALIADLNGNTDIIDAEMRAIRDNIAIVVNGNTAPRAISAGQYLFIKNHSSLSAGGYHATANIANGATITSSNVAADADGVVNGAFSALNSKIAAEYTSDANTVSVGVVQRFRYNSNTLHTPYKDGITGYAEGWIESYLNSASYGIQTAYATGDDVYTRTLKNGTWGSWYSENKKITSLETIVTYAGTDVGYLYGNVKAIKYGKIAMLTIVGSLIADMASGAVIFNALPSSFYPKTAVSFDLVFYNDNRYAGYCTLATNGNVTQNIAGTMPSGSKLVMQVTYETAS